MNLHTHTHTTYTQIENQSDGIDPSFYIWENWGLRSGHFSLECSVTLVCHLCVADAGADTVPNPVPKQEENSLLPLPIAKAQGIPTLARCHVEPGSRPWKTLPLGNLGTVL